MDGGLKISRDGYQSILSLEIDIRLYFMEEFEVVFGYEVV